MSRLQAKNAFCTERCFELSGPQYLFVLTCATAGATGAGLGMWYGAGIGINALSSSLEAMLLMLPVVCSGGAVGAGIGLATVKTAEFFGSRCREKYGVTAAEPSLLTTSQNPPYGSLPTSPVVSYDSSSPAGSFRESFIAGEKKSPVINGGAPAPVLGLVMR